jgi:hypothetical protein
MNTGILRLKYTMMLSGKNINYKRISKVEGKVSGNPETLTKPN